MAGGIPKAVCPAEAAAVVEVAADEESAPEPESAAVEAAEEEAAAGLAELLRERVWDVPQSFC
jgi:hypothetical protein